MDVAPAEVAPELDPAVNALSLVGRRYRVGDYYEVGREKIREYARAVQDYHPVHWDDAIAREYGYPGLLTTPTFIGLLASPAQKALAEILTGYDPTRAMQTDQVLNFHRPCTVGDQLTSNLSLHSFRQAFGGDLMVVENCVTNQYNRPTATAYTSLITRSGSVEKDEKLAELTTRIVRQDIVAGPSPTIEPCATLPPPIDEPDHMADNRFRKIKRGLAFGSVSVGDQLPTRIVSLTIGDLVNYAGVSGDPNPIHWNTGAAELIGLEQGVVAHGMLTMGLGAGFVTSWLDDPGAILQYSVRMTSPVYVSAEQPGVIEYSGKVKSIDSEARTATIAVTAIHAGRKIFGRATVVVQLS